MVKMEMISIIRRGMGGFDYPGVPLDYQEMEVGGGPAGSSYPPVPESNDATTEPEAQSVAAAPAPLATAGGADAGRPRMGGIILAASLSGMAVLVAAISAVVLLKAKRD